jgi:serine/threonine-protein kinase HipA
MITLQVWLRTDTGTLLQAGEIRVAEPDQVRGGMLRGEFRYDPAYLERPGAIALDPIHLPLAPTVFSADRPRAGIHGVFEDSLPDSWGRGLLIRRHRLPRSRQTPPHLLGCLGGQGLGALIYALDSAPPPLELEPDRDTAALIDAAERYDNDPTEIDDDELASLFRAASSPGGARPKLAIDHAGTRCIAKLASNRDRIDMVRTEAACLALARDAGLSVPEFQVLSFGRHDALLVARFDIHGEHGRHHMLSLQTLLGADDWYQLGYADLADLLRRVSARPEDDLPALYRQAVFNALLGNTDDHLKNFALRHIGTEGGGWRLTPAYDLTPDEPPRGEHVLHFGTAGHRPDGQALTDLARTFGLSPRAAARIRAEVSDAISHWRRRFTDYGVGEEDIKRLAAGIDGRLRRCA